MLHTGIEPVFRTLWNQGECSTTELIGRVRFVEETMGHLGFEPRTNRLKAGYSTAELMTLQV